MCDGESLTQLGRLFGPRPALLAELLGQHPNDVAQGNVGRRAERRPGPRVYAQALDLLPEGRMPVEEVGGHARELGDAAEGDWLPPPLGLVNGLPDSLLGILTPALSGGNQRGWPGHLAAPCPAFVPAPRTALDGATSSMVVMICRRATTSLRRPASQTLRSSMRWPWRASKVT